MFDRFANALDGTVEVLMFPDPNHPPALGIKGRICNAVPFDIAPQFGGPIPLVAGRLTSMLGTNVPETPINKHSDPALRKDDVWPDAHATTKVKAMIFAVPETKPVQRAAQSNFGLRVRTPIRPHVLGTSMIQGGRIANLGGFHPGFAHGRHANHHTIQCFERPLRQDTGKTLCGGAEGVHR